MLTLVLGADWTANRDAILEMLAKDVSNKQAGRILLVPELISHDMERRLCAAAGDTCSRFAEVVSFSRLTRRICEWSKCGVAQCLDNGGRLVAMAYAARQLHTKLKAYASVETRPEFLTSLIDAVDEFKRCCISAEDLSYASQQTQGAFAQKLEELSLLLQAYDSICSQGLRDPRDLLTWGLEQLENSDFAQNHIFYIDGFPDFTRQNMAIISYLITNAPNVTVSLNCDRVGTDNLAFEKAGDTASRLLNIAKAENIPVKIIEIHPREHALNQVCEKLFQGKITKNVNLSKQLRVLQLDTVYDECVVAAEQVLELVQNGARFRDISIVCGDMAAYSNALNMQLELCHIPAYIAGTEDILENSAISTVLTALDCALGGLEQKAVLRYLKSALSPLDLDSCDRLETYALMWNIQGKRWLEPWTNHPEGLQDEWNENDLHNLEELNNIRTFAVEPLKQLALGFQKAMKLSHQVDALHQFLQAVNLDERLEQFASVMEAAGDHRRAQLLNQHWEILLTALEQLRDILGDTSWENETFARLFRLLLSQYDVGTIPPVLDTVMVGPVSAMRCQDVKHLIVVGAAEGAFPSYGNVTGVLSDHERTELRQLGIPLTGGASDGLQIEFSEIYGVFCGAKESIYVSCPSGQTSFVYRRLLSMVGEEYLPENSICAAAVNSTEAAAFLCRLGAFDEASKLGISDVFGLIKMKKDHSLGKLHGTSVEKLYGRQFKLSASQVDKQADCRLSYFLKYGLKAQERKPITVDPAEFGTYVHAVLEQTAREICHNGSFKETSLEDALKIAQKYSDEYTTAHFSQLDSERISYLFRRNNHELMMVVEELWRELQVCSFSPIDFEVAFGNGEKLDAITIDSSTVPAQLRGFVDRVDAWKENGQNYFRVVDYKTGKKDFDYCDVLNGLGLQMLLYLFALQEHGGQLLGEHPIPAGVQYFPARAPLISTDGVLTDEEAKQERQSQWKRKGLILNNEDVIFAMENAQEPVRLCCKRKKDGTYSGDLASKEQFTLLKQYIMRVLGNLVDDIASGNITPNPYTRGSSHNACRFCPYGAVCHSAYVAERRNFKTVSAQRFWEEIEKEMKNHG